mgnify:CR=1 FL=1
MSIINKGTAFSNGEQLSANKLNDLLDAATFGIDSVDNASTIVNANGAITVRDSGVTAAKLATGAVTASKILDANVTKAKIENVADYKVLGNVSGAAAAPQEVAILDEDDMVSDSDTALATQQSIKAYVDEGGGFTPSTYNGEESVTLPNRLIIKTGFFSDETGGENKVVDYGSAFPNATISVQLTQVGGTTTSSSNLRVMTYSASGFTMYVNTGPGVLGSFWQAIGY